MNYPISIAALLACTVIFLSTGCTKDEVNSVEPMSGPNITVTSPTEDEGIQGFARGSTIQLLGQITDDKGINEVRVHLVNDHDENLDPDPDAEGVTYEEYTLNQSIVIPENARAGEYRLIVMASDYDANTGKYEARIRIQ